MMRPAITDRGVNVVAVAETRFQPPMGGGADRVIPASELLDRDALDGLPARSQARLLRVAGRHAAVVHDVLDAASLWPSDAIAEAVNDARTLSALLARITTALAGQLTPDQRGALDVALTTGYWHPHLGTHPVAAAQLRPWLVPLEQQWGWLRPIWASTLRRELARSATSITVLAGKPGTEPIAGRAAPPVETGHARARTAVPVRTVAPRGLLEARLLGSLKGRVDRGDVRSWHGQRGISVLRYLLAHPRHGCSRDELLEQFWPHVPASAARNRLQVAISGLRRTFAGITAVNVVEYADGGYRINPGLDVEVDVELFERGLKDAAAAVRAGNREEGRTEYRKAIAVYHGDFAADAPFESWTLLPRESLRIQLADALDR